MRGDIAVIPRKEFASERFDYRPGEHVVFGGPTQHGKTTLAFELLEFVATSDLPAYVAVSKPRDPTTEKYGKKLKFRRVSDWPPRRKIQEIINGNPPGYLVWPKFGNIDVDTRRASDITARLIADRYTAGTRRQMGILVMDDTMIKSRILGLDREMTTILAMAGAMGIGQWVFIQRPTDSGRTSIWSYGQAEHLFITYDPDKRNRQRYDEIGGVDPKYVAQATKDLKPYEFLYIKRTGNFMCIVGAK